MALTSTISIDTIANTAVLNILQNGTTVIDTLTYTNATQNISFIANNILLTLTPQEFLIAIQLYLAFNNALIASIFSPKQNQTQLYTLTALSQSDDGVSQLSFTYQPGNHPLMAFTSTYPNGNIVIGKRNQANILSYAQWLYLVNALGNYRQVIINAYKL